MPIREEAAEAAAHEQWIWRNMEGTRIAAGVRNQLLGALLFQVIENAGAVRLLLAPENGERRFGSAAALIRPIFEMFIRALWAARCASEDELSSLTASDATPWRPPIKEMTKVVDDTCQFSGRFVDIHARYWEAFCSYAHGGLRIIARRNSDEFIGCAATEEEMIGVLRYATLMALIASSIWFAHAGMTGEEQEAIHRAKPYWQ